MNAIVNALHVGPSAPTDWNADIALLYSMFRAMSKTTEGLPNVTKFGRLQMLNMTFVIGFWSKKVRGPHHFASIFDIGLSFQRPLLKNVRVPVYMPYKKASTHL